MKHILYEYDLLQMIQNYYVEDIIELIIRDDHIEIILEEVEE